MDYMQRQQQQRWEVVESRSSPSQVIYIDDNQPQQIIHVHISGAPGWLMMLAQIPAINLIALAAGGGVIGAMVAVAIVALATAVSYLATVAILGIVVIFGLLAIVAMMKG